MNTSLTIRLPEEQRQALRKRAQAFKKNESEFVRDLITREISAGFEFEKVRHLVGSLRLKKGAGDVDSWREHLNKANRRK